MAVRPLVTTGVALLSAGAIVAGTPGLFVPRDEITVASSASDAPAHRTMTAEQINLVALSLDGLLNSFNNGYGAQYYQGTVTATAYVKNSEGKLVRATYDEDGTDVLYDEDGYQLYGADVDGYLVPVTTANLDADGKPVQFYWGNGNAAWEHDPGNCSATGAVCHDGFTGLAYYLSDNILPLNILDNIFFEAGASEFAYLGAVIGSSIVDGFDPTQRLQLSKRVDEFFAGGAAYVAYSIINDNLPDNAVGEWAKGLNGTFYVDGIPGVVNYMVETVKMLIAGPEPEETNSLNLPSTPEEAEAKSETASDISSTSLPNVSKLLNLPTNVESPFQKLVEKLEAPAEPKLVKTLDLKTLDLKTEDITVDKTAEDVTEAATPIVEVSKPETPEVVAPKLPELKLPETKLPEIKLPEIKLPQHEIESVDADADEAATSTESGTASTSGTETKSTTETKPTTETKSTTGTSLVRDSLVAKPERKSTERKKSAGEKFVENATKNLEKAFKATPKTKAGADSHEKGKDAKGDADSGDKDKGKSADK